MPLIYETPTATGAVTTSSDGVLTAETLPAVASVLLTVDFSALATAPERVTVTRSDGLVVRSGDRVWAPGGKVLVFDHEAPLSGAFSYTAVGMVGGTVVATSAAVSVATAAPARTAWLKSVHDPDLSRTVRIVGPGDEEHPLDVGVFRSTQRPFPSVVAGVEQGQVGSLSLSTRTRADYDDLRALSRAGTLLLQTSDDHGLQEMYLHRAGSLPVTRPGGMPGWELRRFELPFVEVGRPSPVGAVLRLPGWSSADVPTVHATCADVAAAYPTCMDLARGPL